MSQFVFFAALLGLLAICFAISALWQKSRALALALALGLPSIAAGLYYLKGEPAALDQTVVAAPTTIEDAVVQLQKRLAAEPNNFEGQVLLARSYMALEKFGLARDAYAVAMKLQPGQHEVAVEYAEAMFRSTPDHRFPAEAVAILEDAVARNPENQRALFFLGTHQMIDHRPAEAAATWEKLLPLLDAQTGAAIRIQIDQARAAAGLPPLPASETTSGSTAALDIQVQIDPTLANLARPGDVLFVFARSLDGSGPPVAAKRIQIDKLPVQLQLTDADSPMPAAKLSAQKQVLVMARLSKSGDVTASSGDVDADPVQVDVTAKQSITLVLNRTVP